MAQPTFNEAYGQQPPASKGSWLHRVSHRASHIPLRGPNNLPLDTRGQPARAGSASEASSPVLTSAAVPRNNSLTALPTRPPGSAGVLFAPSEPPITLRQASVSGSHPASPESPALTEFTATPIDANFGDRVLEQRLATRPPPELPPVLSERRTRGDTIVASIDNNMDKYARQAGDNTYDSDAEADDEFERSVFSSPIIAGHFQDDHSDVLSESEEELSVRGDDTPTTQGLADRDARSPVGRINQWTEEETAEYIASLSPSLKQYAQRIVDEGVNGEALVALHHDDLRDLGVASAGHRLTILKAVYEQKVQAGIRIEVGDYVPLSAEGEKGELNATQDDIARIIESIRLRDQRIIAAEAELKVMKQDLDRISEENKKLREETLPVLRMMKDQTSPLPDPSGATMPSPRGVDPSRQSEYGATAKGSSLTRKFSNKKLFLRSDGTQQSSPTHAPTSYTSQPREVRDDGGSHLEASAAAMAASSHLTASMASQASPNSVQGQQISPTSPAYNLQGPATSIPYQPPSSAASRSFPREATSSRQEHRAYSHADETGTGSLNNSHWSTASTVVPADQPSARLQQDRTRRQAPTPSPREDEAPHGGRERERDNPQVEIFKSFRVSIEDPCRVVLPVALKRYNITDDWRAYALYIVHGDQERCLGLEEKPLLLFKQLDKEGRKPMFMLRRHATPQEGWSGAAGGGIPHTQVQEPKIPGGVL